MPGLKRSLAEWNLIGLAFAAWLCLEGVLFPSGPIPRALVAGIIATVVVFESSTLSGWEKSAIAVLVVATLGYGRDTLLSSAALCLVTGVVGGSASRYFASKLLMLACLATFIIPTVVATVMSQLVDRWPGIASPSGSGTRAVMYAALLCAFYSPVVNKKQSAVAFTLLAMIGTAAGAASEALRSNGLWSFGPLSGMGYALQAGTGVLAAAVVGFQASGFKDSTIHFRSAVNRSLVIGALTGAVVLSLALLGFRVGRQTTRNATFLNVGGFDWKVPTYGSYGSFSSGMFGRLPEYLLATGWTCDAIPQESIGKGELGGVGVLIMINCPIEWKEEEKAAVLDYVRSGGSLLVLGDHTDVFDLQRGFNSLLGGLGIRFNFDSAYSPTTEFNTGWSSRPGFAGASVDPSRAGVGIGASLDVRFPARPIVESKYAFSDLGVRGNTVGAFLGNYMLDENERRGDVILIAERTIGKGTIAVFGDTSGFQNSELPYNFAYFVEPTLSRLATARVIGGGALIEWMLIACAIAALLVWTQMGAPHVLVGLIGTSVLFGGAIAWDRTHFSAKDVFHRTNKEKLALVDYSHFPDVGHKGAGWNSSGALMTCLARSGYLPMALYGKYPGSLRQARLVVIVSPKVAYSTREAVMLIEGGNAHERGILICANAAAETRVNTILQEFGLSIGSEILGRVDKDQSLQAGEVTFVEPSAVVAKVEWATPLFQYGEDTLAVSVKHEKSTLVVIADSRFFSEQNVEGTWGWNAGVLKFTAQVLHSEFGGELGPREPTFEQPEARGLQ